MRFRDSLAVLLLLTLCAPTLAAAPASDKAAPKAKAPVAAKAAKVRTAAKAKAAPAPPPEPPADPATLVIQARAAAARGETDLAIVLAQSAIVADPSRPESYDALGELYAGENQPEFARNFYDKALAIDPGDAVATKAIDGLDRAGDKSVASGGGAKPVAP